MLTLRRVVLPAFQLFLFRLTPGTKAPFFSSRRIESEPLTFGEYT